MDGSHWLSMQIVVKEMQERGHNVSVLAPEASFLLEATAHFDVKTFPVPYNKETARKHFTTVGEIGFDKRPFLQRIIHIIERAKRMTDFLYTTCESLLLNQSLMVSLKMEGYDAVLTDPFYPCGSILASYLSLPFVHFLRGVPCGFLEYEVSQCPSPPSYVPRKWSTTGTDHMSFFQRMKNVFISMTEVLICRIAQLPYEDLVRKVLQNDRTVFDVLSHASIWLLTYDFVFEYPRPLMPNMILIGGIHCKQPSDLSQEIKDIVDSSGEHGIVVFTLGSMISELPVDIAMQFADAFGKIPHKVLWRYTGKAPPNLAENTKLVKWLPQNDLLAHPKTRVFITHGGLYGIYEAICSGVPLIILPLFGDQMTNAKHMVSHGAALSMNIVEISSQDIVDALNKVIYDASFKKNATRLSVLHKDRPIEPLDLAVHWLEFVMRHKGADHLRPAAHDLYWIQYHCLDVIALLVAVVLMIIYLCVKCCLICCRKSAFTHKTKKTKSE